MPAPTTTHGILAAENAEKREEIVELLKTAYWMEIESVMSYIANSVNPDGVRAQEIREALGAIEFYTRIIEAAEQVDWARRTWLPTSCVTRRVTAGCSRDSSASTRPKAWPDQRGGPQSLVAPSQQPSFKRHLGHCHVPCRHSIWAPQRRQISTTTWAESWLTHGK